MTEEPGEQDRGDGVESAAPRRRAAPTIYDIAHLAGVNPSSVSRALNQPGRMSAKTESRIHDAARRLNYRVNPMARALPTGRTNMIGLVIADITNPVVFSIVRGAERAAAERDYTLVLAESEESSDRELKVAERLLQSVDGLILATSRLDDSAVTRLAEAKPLVVVNRVVDNVPGVVADVSRGITEAVDLLALFGHRSVAYLSGPERSWISHARWRSIKERCDWSRMEVTALPTASPTVEGGRGAAAAVRSSGCTAVIAYNDLIAIGLMRELGMAGLQIPRDLSVVGFDDIFGSDFTVPPLTTIQMPLQRQGARAVELILDALKEDSAPRQSESGDLLTHLVVRGSVGPPRSRSAPH
ncbi:MAG: LacI family transcriptional regulator [Naasia sp.]|jgi:DNA-binding LacI/PurR family transcriptional regulator|uniref:LacI family DNA-binding transcriptional regulator n=1 Tax=Naasia sp. TaxID=2546198 RepID=UPI0026080987|nr:LacI family DNA-binding transcriptional regulator [Naasia sp.]MCU1569445.1 LacI family transcriptional regulator [Naasia sp.]